MNLEKATSFIWYNARHLDRAIFDARFYGEPAARVLDIVRTYQNADGGFGHALEPDVRAPDSQPLFVEFALRTLYDNGLRDPDLAYRACDFLARHADLDQGIPTLFPSAQQYPHAGHWTPRAEQPSLDRLIGLVGLANWQGVQHPWLARAVDACLDHLASIRLDDAHTLSCAFCLVESVSPTRTVDTLFDKLAGELGHAQFFCAGTPVTEYGLTPLEFAPAPGAYCRRLFSDAQIDAHLDDLASHQQDDGGWPIRWGPPGEMARCEWRAHKTVVALSTLRAYGRL